MSIAPSYASSADAKKAGWFSRRHQTRAGHDAARAMYQSRFDAKKDREDLQRAETATRKAAEKAAK